MTGDDADLVAVDWRARLAEQTAAWRARHDRRRTDRAERQQRRNHGLTTRHATKLASTDPARCRCTHLEAVHDIGTRHGTRVRTRCLNATGPAGNRCPCTHYTPTTEDP